MPSLGEGNAQKTVKVDLAENMETDATNISDSNINSNINNKLQSPSKNTYIGIESSPYLVCLKSKDKNIKFIHPMKLGKIIYDQNKFRSIIKIKNQAKNQIDIFFENYKEANEFINSDIMEKHNLEAFIPISKTHSIGVIRGVDTDLTIEDIIKYARTDNNSQITNAYRFSRKSYSESGEFTYIPTQTIKLTFRNSLIPRKVFIFHTSCEVEKYKPPINQCNVCKIFGHSARFCRNGIKCGNCSENHQTNTCKSGNMKCPNCSGPHKTRTPTCKIYQQELLIHSKMVNLNLSRIEAKNIIYGKTTYAKLITEKNEINEPRVNTQNQKTSLSAAPVFQFSTQSRQNINQEKDNKKRKMETRQASSKATNNNYYKTNAQINVNGRVPQPQKSKSMDKVTDNTPQDNENGEQLTNAPQMEKPWSEAKFIGSINQVINEMPDNIRYILEAIKQNQLWFYKNNLN